MRIVNLKPESLTPYNKNPRDNSKAIESVARSIRDFGFNQPIVIDRSKVIVVGHTRREAAILEGLSKVPCTYADHLTKAQIKAYRIADNRTNENSYWLEDELAQELLSIPVKQRKSTAFSDEELANMLGEVEAAVPAKAKVGLSEEPHESRKHIVLYFDNDVDWLSARTHFRLRSALSKRRSMIRTGVGGIVDGAKYLRRISKQLEK